ncbi:MAG: sulfotransferase [Steroidobacteraceae bacterium]
MANEDFRLLLDQGLTAHQQGRIPEALTAFRAAIELEPEDAEVASLLGSALAQSEWREHALGFLQRAVELEPEQIGFRMNLAEGLVRLGEFARAQQEFRAVLMRDPGHVRAWDRSGDVAMRLNDLNSAREAWTQARMLAPKGLEPALKLISLEMQRGELGRAQELLDRLAEQFAGDTRLLALQTDLHALTGDWPAYASSVDAWLRQQPGDPAAWRSLARLHGEMGRFRDATNAYGRVLALEAPNVADLTTFANWSLQALDVDAADGALAQAGELAPEDARLLTTRALRSLYVGRFGDAEADCLRCLALERDNPAALITLSRLRRGRMSEAELAGLSRIAAMRSAPVDVRIAAGFAVAHAHEAGGEPAAAFAALEAAHGQARARDRALARGFSVEGLGRRRELLLSLSLPAVEKAPPAPARPIFIVGMPRNGSTLIEAVLAAHPQVLGCGERQALPQVMDALVALTGAGREIDARFLADARQTYYAGLPNLGAADRFTDKQPFNFEAIGLIAHLFPDAVIIALRRNPVANCLSIYRQPLHRNWAFAHEFSDIAAVYAHHQHLLQAFEEQFPGRMVQVNYEDWLADLPAAARALLAACGLPWHEDCLQYRQAARPITTLSAVDVRAPLRGVDDQLAKYASQLPAIEAALRAAGVDPATGQLTLGR